jgi:hypothetical protein
MKLQFLCALLVHGRGADLREAYAPVIVALPYSVATSNDVRLDRPKLACRWRRNPSSGRLEARWSACE